MSACTAWPLCAAPVLAAGLCNSHYLRNQRHGWPFASVRPTLAQKLWRHFEHQPSGCWLWTGYVDPNGYGRFANGGWAHRAMYELIVGPIPDGLHLDHLCRTPLCVNPSHLEPVTPAENVRRAFAAQTHCINGHLFDEANTYRTSAGHRSCRTCHRNTERERKRRLNARCVICAEPTGIGRYCSEVHYRADEGPLWPDPEPAA